ncbi:MAG: SIR2 family protein [Symbiobacteriia bacterium]
MADFWQTQLPKSPLIAARFFRDDSGIKFADEVRSALYEGIPRQSQARLLGEIADLCVPGEDGSVFAVVSYNFDDQLEEALNRKSVNFKLVMSEDDSGEQGELPVYHVHGFLPRSGPITKAHREALILSEDAYHSQFTDPYSWQTITQLSLLRDKVCLFVGFSMTDPNQRRLLEILQRKRPGVRHYALMRDNTAASPQASLRVIQPSVSVLRGLEEASLLGLGVQAIWVRNFTDIPNLLGSIGHGRFASQAEVAATKQP